MLHLQCNSLWLVLEVNDNIILKAYLCSVCDFILLHKYIFMKVYSMSIMVSIIKLICKLSLNVGLLLLHLYCVFFPPQVKLTCIYTSGDLIEPVPSWAWMKRKTSEWCSNKNNSPAAIYGVYVHTKHI